MLQLTFNLQGEKEGGQSPGDLLAPAVATLDAAAWQLFSCNAATRRSIYLSHLPLAVVFNIPHSALPGQQRAASPVTAWLSQLLCVAIRNSH